MADPQSLIIQKRESSLMKAPPRTRPDAVIVLSYRDGSVRTFRGGAWFGSRANSKWCFVVDTSQRFSSGELQIPARGDVAYFQGWFDAGWQVSDPEAIVRNNIEVGEPVVAGFLKNEFWRRGRHFDPRDVQGAEEEIVRTIRPPLAIGSGLALTALTVRLAMDPRLRGSDEEWEDDAHVGRLEQARMQRLRGLVHDDESFLLYHLVQHRDDTGAVLDLITQARERNEKLRLDLLDRMLERGFIQDGDIGPLRDSILGGGAVLALPQGPAGGAAPPTPAITPAITPNPVVVPGRPVGPDPDGPEDLPAAAQPQPDPAPPADGVASWRNLRDRGPRGSS